MAKLRIIAVSNTGRKTKFGNDVMEVQAEPATPNGRPYTCFTSRIESMVGQEIEAEVKESGRNGERSFTINLPREHDAAKPAGRDRTAAGSSAADACALLACATDITVKAIETGLVAGESEIDVFLARRFEALLKLTGARSEARTAAAA